jgi:hypothetical protein
MTTAGQEMRARVSAALDSDDWTEGEKKILRWQFRLLGGYWTAFFEAAIRADDGNLDALARAYPGVISALRSWKFGDLATRLRDADLMD